MLSENKLTFYIRNENAFPYHARRILNKLLLIYFKSTYLKTDLATSAQAFQSELDHFIDHYGLNVEEFNNKVSNTIND